MALVTTSFLLLVVRHLLLLAWHLLLLASCSDLTIYVRSWGAALVLRSRSNKAFPASWALCGPIWATRRSSPRAPRHVRVQTVHCASGSDRSDMFAVYEKTGWSMQKYKERQGKHCRMKLRDKSWMAHGGAGVGPRSIYVYFLSWSIHSASA